MDDYEYSDEADFVWEDDDDLIIESEDISDEFDIDTVDANNSIEIQTQAHELAKKRKAVKALFDMYRVEKTSTPKENKTSPKKDTPMSNLPFPQIRGLSGPYAADNGWWYYVDPSSGRQLDCRQVLDEMNHRSGHSGHAHPAPPQHAPHHGGYGHGHGHPPYHGGPSHGHGHTAPPQHIQHASIHTSHTPQATSNTHHTTHGAIDEYVAARSRKTKEREPYPSAAPAPKGRTWDDSMWDNAKTVEATFDAIPEENGSQPQAPVHSPDDRVVCEETLIARNGLPSKLLAYNPMLYSCLPVLRDRSFVNIYVDKDNSMDKLNHIVEDADVVAEEHAVMDALATKAPEPQAPSLAIAWLDDDTALTSFSEAETLLTGHSVANNYKPTGCEVVHNKVFVLDGTDNLDAVNDLLFDDSGAPKTFDSIEALGDFLMDLEVLIEGTSLEPFFTALNMQITRFVDNLLRHSFFKNIYLTNGFAGDAHSLASYLANNGLYEEVNNAVVSFLPEITTWSMVEVVTGDKGSKPLNALALESSDYLVYVPSSALDKELLVKGEEIPTVRLGVVSEELLPELYELTRLFLNDVKLRNSLYVTVVTASGIRVKLTTTLSGVEGCNIYSIAHAQT